MRPITFWFCYFLDFILSFVLAFILLYNANNFYLSMVFVIFGGLLLTVVSVSMTVFTFMWQMEREEKTKKPPCNRPECANCVSCRGCNNNNHGDSKNEYH